MTREEFKADLYKSYIASGMTDPVLIQEYIQIAESFVFDQKKFIHDDQDALTGGLSKISN